MTSVGTVPNRLCVAQQYVVTHQTSGAIAWGSAWGAVAGNPFPVCLRGTRVGLWAVKLKA